MSISSPKNQNSSGLNAKTNHKSAKFQAQSQAQAISKQPDPQAVLSDSIHTPQQHALMGQAELWARWIAEIELRKKQGLLHAKHETGEDPADGQVTLNLTADQLHPQSLLVGDAAWPSSVMVCDLDQADEGFWQTHADRDCWIFGDTLEHLKQTARQAYASALKASLVTMRAAPPELGELID